MLPSLAKQTVTRIRPTFKDVRGSRVPDWSDPDRKVISGCSVQPASTDLAQDGRVLGILDGITCYMPPNADVLEGDRIEFEGILYTIDGTPRVWQGPGNLSHILLRLVRWSG